MRLYGNAVICKRRQAAQKRFLNSAALLSKWKNVLSLYLITSYLALQQ
jgi:hypothetical protein